MINKKILITGGSGLLGKKLISVLEKNNYGVYSTFYQNKIEKENCFFLDITNKENVEKSLKKVHPDIIIHTAAYTNVDDCEKNKDIAFDVNVQGTENLAIMAKKMGSKFVYISTDYVFDGLKGLYEENDATNPINYYGITKLKGENIVEKICSDFVIARTSVIYGADKNNFALWCINNLKKNHSINIVSDQFTSPTLNTDLAEQLVSLIENDVNGVFHTTGGQRISRFDFAKSLADSFDLDKNLINTASMENMNWIAQRPKDTSLNVSKISKFKKPYKVREALDLLRNEVGG